jgi:hypothetical protein
VMGGGGYLLCKVDGGGFGAWGFGSELRA